jgi:RNA polymerase sigma-70 factor (ECF subfamily)
MSDNPLEELLEKLTTGDNHAAEQVFLTYEPYLRMVVRRMLPAKMRSKFDSIDVVHSVWADLLDGFRQAGWRFADAAHLRAFLVKATRNRFLDRMRHHKKAVEHEQSLDASAAAGQVLAQESDRPSQVAQAADLWDQILELCLPDHRPVLELKRTGLSIQEIAARTGYHPSSVRRILYNVAQQFAAATQAADDKAGTQREEGA